MAALGKIRSKGVILICIIGFALFAFIADEMFRSCEATQNESRQQVGEVMGEKVNVNEFQALVDEYTNVIKMTQGKESLTDDELNQIKDMVWNNYVQNKMMESEAKKVGLTVTDEEMQNILKEGTNPMLTQTPFVNRETGRFDVNMLQKFLAEYKQAQSGKSAQMNEQYKSIYDFWSFVEKSLRQQVLAQKYQALLAGCFLSNPVSAKQAFVDENQESNIQLVSFPYASVNDKQVKVEEADLKAKYDELKPRFKQYDETRDIKYVDFQILPSTSDRAALGKEFAAYKQELSANEDPTEVVRKSTSLISYNGIAQTKAAFPQDIASKLDSMAVGSVLGPVETKEDNTLNLIRLVARTSLPDSVEFRAIQVGGESVEAAKKSADSIYTALQAGADFETVAKNYGQTGAKQWITSAQYQSAPSLDKDTKQYINVLNTAAVNAVTNLAMTQGNIILQVTDRKAMTDKYNVAVIKKSIDFSKATSSAAYNRFSQFVSENQTLEAMEKNAPKYGFTVNERKDLRSSEHYIANIHNTRDAMKWIFDAKEGTISPLYECGANNDHLLVIAMTKVHEKGYRTLEDDGVKDYIKAEVMKDKKAEVLLAKLQGVKSVAAAKAKGGKVEAVNQVTFASPVFISSTGMSEPALSGAVAATKKGAFSSHAVKGNGGVYLFQVASKVNRPVKYNAAEYEQRAKQKAMQWAGNFMQEIYIKANVKDNRYLFF